MIPRKGHLQRFVRPNETRTVCSGCGGDVVIHWLSETVSALDVNGLRGESELWRDSDGLPVWDSPCCAEYSDSFDDTELFD